MNTPRPKRKNFSDYGSNQNEQNKTVERSRAVRETVESIVVAVILAFLFRSFVAEAFVIPTGSMAPTLQGRHMDVECPQCGHQYRAGASSENGDRDRVRLVRQTTCPMCRYELVLDRENDPNQNSFNGDRILVSKFAYVLGKPQRWDVIVFKYPGNAKQNYIKRLVGLPGETIRIRHGDIHFRPLNDKTAAWQIARKPDHKLLAMLQGVADTKYIAEAAKKLHWPAPFRNWSRQNGDGEESWEIKDGGAQYATDGTAEHDVFVRFEHRIFPWSGVQQIVDVEALDDLTEEELTASRARVAELSKDIDPHPVTDYYAYNDFFPSDLRSRERLAGMDWVGDLALEAVVTVQGSTGELLLDLVEGGVHYECRIDVSSGAAKLSIDGGRGKFGQGDAVTATPQADTVIRKPGQYSIRLANVDDEVRLWVNDKRVKFDSATTYVPADEVAPKWTESDPLDLAPAGVGSRGLAMNVDRIRVFRDAYYIAEKIQHDPARGNGDDPEHYLRFSEYPNHSEHEVLSGVRDFRSWNKMEQTLDAGRMFAGRASVEFDVPANAYFPMGDNSPASKDARYWTQPEAGKDKRPGILGSFVPEELMIGKAMMIYWPHAWKTKLKLGKFRLGVPNFERMGFIR